MGQGRPTSRPSNYVTDLEILLETKNERIEELKSDIQIWKRDNIALSSRITELEQRVAQQAIYDDLEGEVSASEVIAELQSRIEAVQKVRDALATQTLNSHAVAMLDKALGGQHE